MDPELLPPPPPYTPQDPLLSPSQGASSPINALLVHSGSVDTAASIHTSSAGNIPREVDVSNTANSGLSDNHYFRERTPTQPAPEKVVSYRMVIRIDSNPEQLGYPEPAETFSTRGLTKQDWLTYLNHLFPAHSIKPKHTDFSIDKKSSLRTCSKPVSTSLLSGEGSPDEEKQFTRRSEIHDVVQEWNTGFFLPRGLLIIAIIQPYSSKQSEVSSISPFGETALSKAVSGSKTQTVQTLLLKGADPNLKNSSGTPVLCIAIEKRNFPMVQLLLRHGSTIDSKALHLAASIPNDTHYLTLLLTHGANPNTTASFDNFSALHNATTRSDIPTARLLLTYGAKPDTRPIGANTPLYQAFTRKDMPMTQLLLAHGADPNIKPWGGQPILHLATQQSDLEGMRLLLAKGAKVNAEQVTVGTALGLAVESGDSAAVELLLAAGADPNLKPWAGQTPLFCAAGKADLKIMEMLLAKGAKINESPPGFGSALSMAVARDDEETAKTLLRGGADVNVSSPLSIAINSANVPLIELLLENGADVNKKPWGSPPNLYTAASTGNTRVVKLLLDKGAIVDEAPMGFPTALFAAVSIDDLETAKVLLEYGADMKKKKAGYDTLSWAQTQGNEDVLRLLSKYQAKG